MEVQLYVYDLSRGLARQFSRQFLGTYIDAVYHTSIVLEGIEYFFGAGLQTAYAGRTHHGAPMEVISLGKTELPMEVILEYLESLKETYTAESYDLFMHNCNNFSHDFAMFLVGKGIPAHITSLPQTVLNTPFGQMLKPQLDAAMRTVTQAPVPPSQRPARTAVSGQVVQSAVQQAMSSQTKPHSSDTALAKYPALAKIDRKPITCTTVPPLEKLVTKLGSQGKDPVIPSITSFIRATSSSRVPNQETPLPDLQAFATWLKTCIQTLPPQQLFAAYDLTRIMMTETRVSGWFLADGLETLVHLFTQANTDEEASFALIYVALQLGCNLLSSQLAGTVLFGERGKPLLQRLIEFANKQICPTGFSESETSKVSAVASSLLFNLALVHLQSVASGSPGMESDQQIEIAANLLEVLGPDGLPEPTSDEQKTSVKRLVQALAFILSAEDGHGEVRDLCGAMDAKRAVERRVKGFRRESWIGDVVKLF